ncbi:ferrochelatase-2, chloroplastic [Gossypium hirsutum]|uniref:Ferrochelatase n=1 Tax=Gossypium hirsutum TaxID=3635 RepID=A0A1U8J255_GOSHI|nr:ferrochelatase-2, chloroplastic-like [Gossypium hirsutum]
MPLHTCRNEKLGVLLVNIGGPENLNDVQPFLCNLFADPDVIRLPKLFKFLQRPLAKLISILLAPKTKQRYAAIGGGSPLRRITDEQADALRTALEAKNLHANVYVGMRCWYPFMEEAIQQQIKWDRITKLVLLPLFPQFSISTTGSSIRVLQRIFMDDAYLLRLPVSIIRFWYRRQGYIRSIADSIVTQLSKFEKPEEVLIFFSAHGVPVSYDENAGDPYKDQIEECIYLITREHRELGRVPALGCTSSFITDLADAVVEALPTAKSLSILRETAKESDCR